MDPCKMSFPSTHSLQFLRFAFHFEYLSGFDVSKCVAGFCIRHNQVTEAIVRVIKNMRVKISIKERFNAAQLEHGRFPEEEGL